jgi:hypothetical protein
VVNNSIQKTNKCCLDILLKNYYYKSLDYVSIRKYLDKVDGQANITNSHTFSIQEDILV